MRIMLVSNAPWAPTGYGTQIESLSKRLVAGGYTVAQFANWGLKGRVIRINGVEIFPAVGDDLNDPIIHGHVAYWRPDIVISLKDAWGAPSYGGRQFRWIPWTPVDHVPAPKLLVKVLAQAWRVLSFADFGRRELEKAGIANTLIPLGVEKDFSYTEAGRKEFREAIGVEPDEFLFGMVGINAYYPSRKGYDRAFEAIALLRERGIKVRVYCHTSPEGFGGAINLEEVAEALGVRDSVMFPPLYEYQMGYSRQAMAAMYSGLDCLLQPAQAEGFGLPIIEAQACGTPVIGTDCTSIPELVCPETGILVPPITKYMTPAYAFQYLIDVDKLADAMSDVMVRPVDVRETSSTWAKQWDWDTLFALYWKPFLDSCAEEVGDTASSALIPYPVLNEIGGGASGAKLYNVSYNGTGAVAKVDVGGYVQDMDKEIDLLKSLDHPGIIKVLAQGQTRHGRPYFLMPRYDISLDSVATLSEVEAGRILSGVRDAIHHLEHHGWAHRDIHPTNVALTEDRSPVLLDFGWARPIPEGEVSVDWVGEGKEVVSTVAMGIDHRGFHTIQLAVLKRTYPQVWELLQKQRATGLNEPYQQIMGIGERPLETRWQQLAPGVKGKTVLDLGCNLGMFCDRCLSEGASVAWGLDHDPPIIEAAQLLSKGNFAVADVDKLDKAAVLHVTGMERFDVVFALGLIMHVDREHLMVLLNDVADVVYLECPRQDEYRPNWSIDRWAEWLTSYGWRVERLGISDRQRPLMRLKMEAKA